MQQEKHMPDAIIVFLFFMALAMVASTWALFCSVY